MQPPNKTSLTDYYAKRASEYERIYTKPERQADLATLKQLFTQTLAGHNVLEIACGTGYWTQPVSQTAKSILATDFNEEPLDIARAKTYCCDVKFRQADAFQLGALAANHFTAGLAVHWWSHVLKLETRRFLDGYRRLFPAGATLVFMDNQYVPGSSTPIHRIDEVGNTYQLRKLDDGSTHEVLKNFPTEAEMKSVFESIATDWCWKELEYFWVLICKLR